MVRALFLDIDGTLVGPSNCVSPRVRRSVGRAREAGCEVVLCTGRSRVSAEPIAEQLGVRGYAILSNGAVVMHLGTREVLCRNLIPIPAALLAVRRLLAAGTPPQVYEDAVESARILYHPGFPVSHQNPDRHQPWPELAGSLPFQPICISTFGPEEQVRPVAESLQADPVPGTYVEQAGTYAAWCLEVHHLDSGKCNALRRIAGRLGLRQEEILAVGDHINDIQMLRFAGTGVAMGNAQPEARAAADFVTGTLEEDGVAEAIERFVLGNGLAANERE
jgi:hydroxymethylpyrimidine pyrophosphatase-like HAD family hydrolase